MTFRISDLGCKLFVNGGLKLTPVEDDPRNYRLQYDGIEFDPRGGSFHLLWENKRIAEIEIAGLDVVQLKRDGGTVILQGIEGSIPFTLGT